jgi:hypothetical protein
LTSSPETGPHGSGVFRHLQARPVSGSNPGTLGTPKHSFSNTHYGNHLDADLIRKALGCLTWGCSKGVIPGGHIHRFHLPVGANLGNQPFNLVLRDEVLGEDSREDLHRSLELLGYDFVRPQPAELLYFLDVPCANDVARPRVQVVNHRCYLSGRRRVVDDDDPRGLDPDSNRKSGRSKGVRSGSRRRASVPAATPHRAPS